MNEYGIGPTPKFHYDIEGMDEYYLLPSDSNFYIALDGEKIIATAAIRAYDVDYELFRGVYSKEDTASIWRLMVDRNYRRNGIAGVLVELLEDFARDEGYSRIYLHTHRYLEAGLPFWKSAGFEITVEEDDYDETTHMVKYL
jgi:GNAT superfamily N-acetyltransferase